MNHGNALINLEERFLFDLCLRDADDMEISRISKLCTTVTKLREYLEREYIKDALWECCKKV